MLKNHVELCEILERLHKTMALLDGDIRLSKSHVFHLSAGDEFASKTARDHRKVELLKTLTNISTLINGGNGNNLSEDEKTSLRKYITSLLQYTTQIRIESILSNAIYIDSIKRSNHERRIQIWSIYDGVLRDNGWTPKPRIR